MHHTRLFFLALGLAVAGGAIGCGNRMNPFGDNDPAVSKAKSTELAADAAKRFPFPEAAPSGGDAVARAEVNHDLNYIELVNLSPEAWEDVEVWVNRQYVVHLPKVEPGSPSKPQLTRIRFASLFNEGGNRFPSRGAMIDTVEVYRDGKIYTVPTSVTY